MQRLACPPPPPHLVCYFICRRFAGLGVPITPPTLRKQSSTHSAQAARKLTFAICLCLTFMVVELVGGWLASRCGVPPPPNPPLPLSLPLPPLTRHPRLSPPSQ